MTAHIKIVQHPNSDRRTVHVNRHVSDFDALGFGDSHYSNFENKKPGELAEKLATSLGYIPGVTGGDLKQYEIAIGKGEAFTWAEVMPLVIGQVIAKIFPDSVGEMIEISTSVNYMSGDYGRSNDIADRLGVKVEFDLNDPNPSLDIEHLFDPQSVRLAVDNTPSAPETDAPAAEATQEPAPVRAPRRGPGRHQN
jgi:hypothetical protein